jgi:signal peptidase II
MLLYVTRSRIQWVALLLLAADQTAKLGVERRLALGSEQTVWPGVLTLTHAANVGLAMGWMEQFPEVGLVASLAAALGVLIFALSLPAWVSRVPAALAAGMSCALAGAAGNTLDRLRLGYVMDFIGLPNGLTFNLADLMIACAALLIARPLWTALGAPAARKDRVPIVDTGPGRFPVSG